MKRELEGIMLSEEIRHRETGADCACVNVESLKG